MLALGKRSCGMPVRIETGRPRAMQSKPVLMDAVFDDADEAIRRIRASGPFETLLAYHKALGKGPYDVPMFRHAMTDAFFLDNPNWIEAARRAFNAAIVQPVRCLLNLSPPMEELMTHTDLPTFRGFEATAESGGLLMPMINSQLFFDWMVPFASGLAWFYRGEGGSFLYWADGTDALPRFVHPPFWNCGVMSDNEAMFHAVSAVGSPQARRGLAGLVRRSDRISPVGDADWEITGDEHPAIRLGGHEIRMSLLWRARVFRDEEHMASFEDKAHDLTPERIADVFLEDLARRGQPAREPGDPLDPEWVAFLTQAYPPSFTPATADFMS
jgi:hypothetical protein